MTSRGSDAVPAIEVKDLVKDFPAHRRMRRMLKRPFSQPQTRVLDGVTLCLEPGEVLGLMGANGAGKTTLLKIIAAIIRPTEGSVVVNGWDVVTHPREAKSQAAYAFMDERSFYWRLTGRQNLDFFAAIEDLNGSQRRRVVNELASLLGIADRLDEPFSFYSTGLRQRFALARALLRRPRVLLLDEPTRSIDPAEAKSIWSFVRDDLVQKQQMSAIVVTHQTAEAAALCDRISILEGGRIRAELLPADLKRASDGLRALTLTLAGFRAEELPRLRLVPGIRGLTLNDQNGEQRLDVWYEDETRALTEVVALTTASGAQVRSLTQTTPIPEVLKRLMNGKNGDAF
jgi:ABC-2 type transport system ATP-binding protein